MKDYCFYCDGVIVGRSGKGDHFPVPQRHGGKETVPCCQSCHDMKDRLNVGDWSVSWAGKVIADFPQMSRETRIFLAKTLTLLQDMPK